VTAPKIERAMEELAREPKGGLVALNDSFMYVNRQLIIGLPCADCCLQSRLGS
jgi:hypothetical protein